MSFEVVAPTHIFHDLSNVKWHLDNGICFEYKTYVKMHIIVCKCWFNQFCNLSFINAIVKKVHSTYIDLNTKTMVISTNFRYSFNLWINNPLVLIIVHNLVIRLTSNGSTMALCACVFIVNLNMDIYKSKMATSKNFEISNNECFALFGWH